MSEEIEKPQNIIHYPSKKNEFGIGKKLFMFSVFALITTITLIGISLLGVLLIRFG